MPDVKINGQEFDNVDSVMFKGKDGNSVYYNAHHHDNLEYLSSISDEYIANIIDEKNEPYIIELPLKESDLEKVMAEEEVTGKLTDEQISLLSGLKGTENLCVSIGGSKLSLDTAERGVFVFHTAMYADGTGTYIIVATIISDNFSLKYTKVPTSDDLLTPEQIEELTGKEITYEQWLALSEEERNAGLYYVEGMPSNSGSVSDDYINNLIDMKLTPLEELADKILEGM